MNEDAHKVERAERPESVSHGGRPGWYRVAGGFSALAAFGMGYQAFSVAHPSTNAVVFYPRSLALALAVGALLLGLGSFLALRCKPYAAFPLLLGYLLPAVTIFAILGIVVPPDFLLVISALALIVTTRRRGSSPDPAA